MLAAGRSLVDDHHLALSGAMPAQGSGTCRKPLLCNRIIQREPAGSTGICRGIGVATIVDGRVVSVDGHPDDPAASDINGNIPGSLRGNSSIFAGSYEWSNAGRFHHAQSQLKRFLNTQGGFVHSEGNYSYNAALGLMPHIVGPYRQHFVEATRWLVIAKHTDLVVLFGGLALRNTNARGCCLAGAKITDEISAGCVFLWTGAWYDPDYDAPQARDCHGNPNVLTHDLRTSSLTQSPAAHSAMVEMKKFEGRAKPVEAHDPPHFLLSGR